MVLHSESKSRVAFSLIEVLVVIGVIGIILSIILPALGKGRESAQRMVSLSNLRSIGQFVHVYTDRNDSAYPWLYRGVNGCGISIGFGHAWGLSAHWPIALYTCVERTQLRPIQLAPGATREGRGPLGPCVHLPSYYYSQSFLALPEVWSGEAVADESLLGHVRTDMVTYPSDKCLMWEWELPYLHREPEKVGPDLAEPTPMLFADGHGDQRTPADAAEPVVNPFFGATVPTARLHNTPDGVHGRDY